MVCKNRATWLWRAIVIVVTSIALTVGFASTAAAAPSTTLPALPAIPKIPLVGANNAINQALQPGSKSSLLGGGSPNTGNSATVDGQGRTNASIPWVPFGGVRKQYTSAPNVEASTKPACAPYVIVAVPGTFEINRDDNPNKPVGMLAKVVELAKQSMGSKVTSTFINYDGDAGINGTSYLRSVEQGGQKTLATVTDVASRCSNAVIILIGYSQGARIAGDVATAIGQKRTSVDYRRIGGVALFSDPMRAQNSNIITGTNQNRPNIPGFLENAVGNVASDPSFAQMQLTTTDAQGLLGQAGTTLGNLAGGLLNSVTGQKAGSDASSTSTPQAGETATPDTSDTTEPAPSPDNPTTTVPSSDAAGAAWRPDSTLQVRPVEDVKSRPRATDELRKIPADNPIVPAGVTSVGGPDGQWLPVNAMTRKDLTDKAAAGWVFGRTAAQKALRRKVIDDLYLYGWDGCKDNTLSSCYADYVDGVAKGTAPGILTPSSELTATRDSLGVKANPTRPKNGDLSTCATVTATVCTARVALKAAKQRDLDASRTASPLTDEEFQKIYTRITGVRGDDGKTVPIVTAVKNLEGDRIIKGAALDACYNPTIHYPADQKQPDAKHNGWLRNAWTRHVRWNNGRSPQKVAEHTFSGQSTACMVFLAQVAELLRDNYAANTLVFDDPNFVPANAPSRGNKSRSQRTSLVRFLYVYGGCGDSDKAASPAPTGNWSWSTCSREFGDPADGSRGRFSNLGEAQLRVKVDQAQTAYAAAQKDWSADVFRTADFGATNDGNPYILKVAGRPLTGHVAFPCSSMSARLCAILKTRIVGPADRPAGLNRMVHPDYPTAGTDGRLYVGDNDTSATIDLPKGADGTKEGRDGYVWATPAVMTQVAKLDQARRAVRGAPSVKTPTGVTSLINSITGQTRVAKGINSGALQQLLDTGWVWGRTTDADKARPDLINQLYSVGGCGARTLSLCQKNFAGSDPTKRTGEYALTNDEVKTKIADGTRLVASGKVAFSPDAIPADLSACTNKTIVACAPKPTATPSKPGRSTNPVVDTTTSATPSTADNDPTTEPPADNSGGGDDSTGGSDNTGSDIPVTAPTTPAAGDTPTTSAQRAGSPTTPSATPGSDSGSPSTGDDLAGDYAGLLTGSTTTSTAEPTTTSRGGGTVPVSPITQKAVAGGGLEGKRSTDFGTLTGMVVSLCVPGDLVCSLPENSKLATALVKFARNVSLDFPDMLSAEGATRMGGLLALQALNTVADITGMPRTKLSADTLQALVNIVAGATMLGVTAAAPNPATAAAGSTLLSQGVSQLPNALPEIFSQLADIPSILAKLPTVVDTTLRNTGLDEVITRINSAFQKAGMTSPTQLDKLPKAIPAMMEALTKDNTGLLNIVTNPQYWQATAHTLYPTLKISGSVGSTAWVGQWVVRLGQLSGQR